MTHQTQETTSTSVAETLTSILQMNIAEIRQLWVDFSVADYDLDQFVVKLKGSANGESFTLYSTAAHYQSPDGIVLLYTNSSGSSGGTDDLTTVQATKRGKLLLNVEAFSSIDIQAASSNASGSTVSAYAGGL